MKLKGDYSSGTSYNVGDVVRFQGKVYNLQHPCPAGIPPVDTLYWGRTSQIVEDIVNLCMDAIDMANSDDVQLEDDLTQTTAGKKALDAHQGKVLKGLIDAITVPDNIGPSSIVLNSSTESSTKQFLLTIADPASGDDPELTITEIVPDTPAEEGSET
jgi:hypothetical protein